MERWANLSQEDRRRIAVALKVLGGGHSGAYYDLLDAIEAAGGPRGVGWGIIAPGLLEVTATFEPRNPTEKVVY